MCQERDLKNKVAVITGGADGIGFQICRYFLKGGATSVVILDIDEELCFEAVKKLKSKYGGDAAEFIKCDVTVALKKVSKEVIEKYGHVDVLVNNAAITDDGDMRKVIEVNLLAVMEWSKEFHDHMRVDKGGKGGTIINISSIYGFRSNYFAESYSAAKHGILGFTKTLGHKENFKSNAVRVIAICPGFTETKLVNSNVEFEDFLKILRKTHLWQKPEDVGKAAVEVYERAESGSVWIIEGAKAIQELRPSDQ